MAPLDRALAFDERQHRSVLVAEQLHLDVPRPRQPSLDVDGGVAECRVRFRARGAHGAGEVRRIENRAHAFAAAARHGFDEQRIADASRERLEFGVGDVRPGPDRRCPGTTGTPARSAAARAAVLLSHQPDGLGRRADERQAGIAHGAGEPLVFREEPVPRMHGVGARFRRGLDDPIDPKIAVARRAPADRVRLVGVPHVQRGPIALGVDGDRRNAHLAARTGNPDGDFAAVGDENLLHETRLL